MYNWIKSTMTMPILGPLKWPRSYSYTSGIFLNFWTILIWQCHLVIGTMIPHFAFNLRPQQWSILSRLQPKELALYNPRCTSSKNRFLYINPSPLIEIDSSVKISIVTRTPVCSGRIEDYPLLTCESQVWNNTNDDKVHESFLVKNVSYTSSRSNLYKFGCFYCLGIEGHCH